MNQNWNKIIKEHYPKVYEKLINYFRAINDIYKICNFKEKDLETLCHCELEDFFESQGIDIELNIHYNIYKKWDYCLFPEWLKDKTEYYILSEIAYSRKQDARENAVLKACEILEENYDSSRTKETNKKHS